MVIYDEHFVSMLTLPVTFKKDGSFDGVLGLKDVGFKRVLLSGTTHKQYQEICEFLYKDKGGYV